MLTFAFYYFNLLWSGLTRLLLFSFSKKLSFREKPGNFKKLSFEREQWSSKCVSPDSVILPLISYHCNTPLVDNS
jgi:hypothetical protein